MVKRVLNLFVVLVLLLATSCTHIAIPVMFDAGVETNTIEEVAIAVDGSGVKHVLFTERVLGDFYPNLVVYLRSVSGEESVKTSYSYMGGNSSYPDIAATFNGRAYLVWLQYSEGVYRHFWAYLDPDDEFMQEIVAIDPAYVGYRAPKVAGPVVNSAADRVYAVYEVQNGTGSALRYREMSNLTNTGWVSAHPANATFRRDQSLAVGSDGVMHVAWVDNSAKAKSIFYNNNYAQSGDLGENSLVNSGNISLPVVAAGASGGTSYGFVVYSLDGTPNDSLYVSVGICNTISCSLSLPQLINTVPKDWQISGKPAATAYGDTVYIAFSADNTDTSGGSDEIFLASYDYSAGTPVVEQLTSNGGENLMPAITLTTDFSHALPVVAWLYDDPASSDYHVKLYDAYHDAFTTLDTDANAASLINGIDLANANYLYLAGGWTGPKAPKKEVSVQNVAWMSYNDYGNFLPMISR